MLAGHSYSDHSPLALDKDQLKEGQTGTEQHDILLGEANRVLRDSGVKQAHSKLLRNSF